MGYYRGDYYAAGDYYMAGGKLAKLGKLGKGKLGRIGKAGAAMAGKKLLGHLLAKGGRHHGRRMHVTNVKALRRAMRRVQGFARTARKVMTFTHHHKMKKSRRR